MHASGPPPDTLDDALRWGRAELAASSESAALDAEVLLLHVLDCTRSALRAWPERLIDRERAARFQALIGRRREGWPVAYLTGEREFWSRSFHVGPGVLIPRHETELLIELALERLPPDAGADILDLGTGSGIIALTLAAERPGCRVSAIDASTKAIATAQHNALRLGLGRVRFVPGHWLDPLAAHDRFDLMVSNPPYIPEQDPHLGQGDLLYEPREALASGSDGLAALREIIDLGRAHLNPGGWLILEHGYDQSDSVAALLAGCAYREMSHHRDLQGHRRATVARYG